MMKSPRIVPRFKAETTGSYQALRGAFFSRARSSTTAFRASAIAGPGYELIRSDTVLLLLRAGTGFSREFAGADNRFNPELNVGGDYEYTITDYQRLVARADIFPSLLNFPSDYRIALNGAYEVRLNTAVPLLLKLGVENRYESEPTGGKRRNDLLYFLNIVHSF